MHLATVCIPTGPPVGPVNLNAFSHAFESPQAKVISAVLFSLLILLRFHSRPWKKHSNFPSVEPLM